MTLQSRFIVKCGTPTANGCIPWLAGSTRTGYGIFRIGKRRTTAHRISWMLKHGDIPIGYNVLHRCDNPSCVNVDHLFLGTPKENTHDMMAKDRHGWRNGTPWQKLDSVDGERIRDLRRARYPQQDIADWLHVSRPLISMVLGNKIQHSTALIGT